VKRTVGLAFYLYLAPANRTVDRSQSTHVSVGATSFVLGSQAKSGHQPIQPGHPYQLCNASQRLLLSLDRSRLVSRLTPVSRLELSMRASSQGSRRVSSQAPSWTGSTPPPSQWTPAPAWPTPSQGPTLSPLLSGALTQEPAGPWSSSPAGPWSSSPAGPWSSSPAGPTSPLAQFSTPAGALMSPAGSSAVAWTPSCGNAKPQRGVINR
jgi:hypothetical protein